MNNANYDLLVIGAGPGGYVAAIRAAQLGLKAAVIEKDKLGGVCLNIGCIPSKTLIHQAEHLRSIQPLLDMGITVDRQGLDFAKVLAKSRAAADQLSKGIQHLLKKNQVDVIAAEAVKIQPGLVELADGSRLQGKNILIATGSRPRELQGFEFDEQTVLSSSGALMLEKLPERMLILGSGAIGVEFAHVLNAFGVEVHLVEMLDRILPLEDDESTAHLTKSFQARGIKIHTSTRALSHTDVSGRRQVTLKDHQDKTWTLTVDQILVSAGRQPNTEQLGLQEAGVTRDEQGFIQVGEYYQTDVPGIYAIGDVIRSPLLAHVASAEAEIAVEHMAGRSPKPALDPLAIPAATYCEPQVASFGYTERQAQAAGLAFKKLLFPYRGIGKAVASDAADGQIKILLAKDSGEMLGAHIVGAQATELIHELLLTRSAELLPEDIAGMIHAHPTLSEGLAEAMRQALDGAIHI